MALTMINSTNATNVNKNKQTALSSMKQPTVRNGAVVAKQKLSWYEILKW